MADQYTFDSKEEIVQSFVVKNGKVYSSGQEILLAAKGDSGRTPQKGIDYNDGADGIGRPPAYEVSGTKIRFENPNGTWGPFVDLKGGKGDPGYYPVKGIDYFDGEPGRTPEKGVDYRDGNDGVTPKKGVDYKDGLDGLPGVEPEEMVSIRIELARTRKLIKEMQDTIDKMVERVDKVKDGVPGRTPEKGVDYRDGNDGVTPVKGVDYRDGEDAKIPESVTMTVITDVKLIEGNLSIKRQDVKFYKD